MKMKVVEVRESGVEEDLSLSTAYFVCCISRVLVVVFVGTVRIVRVLVRVQELVERADFEPSKELTLRD